MQKSQFERIGEAGKREGGGGGEISIQGRSQETHSDETLLTEELLFWLYVRGSFEWKKTIYQKYYTLFIPGPQKQVYEC